MSHISNLSWLRLVCRSVLLGHVSFAVLLLAGCQVPDPNEAALTSPAAVELCSADAAERVFDLHRRATYQGARAPQTDIRFVSLANSAPAIYRSTALGLRPMRGGMGFDPQQSDAASTAAAYISRSGAELLSSHPAAADESPPRIGWGPSVSRGVARGDTDPGVQIFRENAESVTVIKSMDGMGSGLLVQKDGLILTNHHVVGDSGRVFVFFRSALLDQSGWGDAKVGTVLCTDPKTDLALVKLARRDLQTTPATLGTIDSVEVGSSVYAIGHPKGLYWTFTRGVVSQIRPSFQWGGDPSQQAPSHQATVIQTQTPINPGNSGGPLFNGNGEVIGINSFIDAESEGIAFAVASSEIERIIDECPARLPSVSAERPPTPIEALDQDADGRIETYVFDRSRDGRADLWLYDLGVHWPGFAFDSTGSGEANTTACDANGDGVPDYFHYDDNHDGRVDVVGIDLTGDGTMDRIKHL